MSSATSYSRSCFLVPQQEKAALWRRQEWPSWVLTIAIYGAWLALTWSHASLPWWFLVVAGGWTTAWHLSLQHEIVHGHPTRNRWVNTALGFPPLALWLPFERYRRTHLAHHRSAILTHPTEDPESFYLTRACWERLPALSRFILTVLGTLAGRILIGPFLLVGHFLWLEMRLMARRPGQMLRAWGPHMLGVAGVLAWVVVICDMPLWIYLASFVYPATALTLIRSFAEHRAAREADHRTAIVENSPVLGLLFLYNNLHVAHHAAPALPWFELPAFHRANRAALLRRNNGLIYRGYGEVMRRYLFRAHDQIAHPLDRPSDRPGHAARQKI